MSGNGITPRRWAAIIGAGLQAGTAASGGGFFLIFILAFEEVRYVCSGVTTDATVTEAYLASNPDHVGRGPGEEVKIVGFVYHDRDHAPHRGFDHVARDDAMEAGQSVRVQYVPGNEFMTRLEGHRNLAALWVMASLLGCFAVCVGLLVRDANRQFSKPRTSKRAAGRGALTVL